MLFDLFWSMIVPAINFFRFWNSFIYLLSVCSWHCKPLLLSQLICSSFNFSSTLSFNFSSTLIFDINFQLYQFILVWYPLNFNIWFQLSTLTLAARCSWLPLPTFIALTISSLNLGPKLKNISSLNLGQKLRKKVSCLNLGPKLKKNLFPQFGSKVEKY